MRYLLIIAGLIWTAFGCVQVYGLSAQTNRANALVGLRARDWSEHLQEHGGNVWIGLAIFAFGCLVAIKMPRADQPTASESNPSEVDPAPEAPPANPTTARPIVGVLVLLLLMAVVAVSYTAVGKSDAYRQARERSRYGMTREESSRVGATLRQRESETTAAIQADLDRMLKRKGGRRLSPLVSLGEQAVRTPDGPTMCLVLDTRVVLANGFETVIQMGFGNKRLGPVKTRGSSYGRLSREGPMLRGPELRQLIDSRAKAAGSRSDSDPVQGIDPGDELEAIGYGEAEWQDGPHPLLRQTWVLNTRQTAFTERSALTIGPKGIKEFTMHGAKAVVSQAQMLPVQKDATGEDVLEYRFVFTAKLLADKSLILNDWTKPSIEPTQFSGRLLIEVDDPSWVLCHVVPRAVDWEGSINSAWLAEWVGLKPEDPAWKAIERTRTLADRLWATHGSRSKAEDERLTSAHLASLRELAKLPYHELIKR